MTIDDLRRILASCAGEDEALGYSEDIRHANLGDLGCDSLALMEIAARISHEYAVSLGDDDLSEQTTAQELLDRVNGVRQAA